MTNGAEYNSQIATLPIDDMTRKVFYPNGNINELPNKFVLLLLRLSRQGQEGYEPDNAAVPRDFYQVPRTRINYGELGTLVCSYAINNLIAYGELGGLPYANNSPVDVSKDQKQLLLEKLTNAPDRQRPVVKPERGLSKRKAGSLVTSSEADTIIIPIISAQPDGQQPWKQVEESLRNLQYGDICKHWRNPKQNWITLPVTVNEIVTHANTLDIIEQLGFNRTELIKLWSQLDNDPEIQYHARRVGCDTPEDVRRYMRVFVSNVRRKYSCFAEKGKKVIVIAVAHETQFLALLEQKVEIGYGSIFYKEMSSPDSPWVLFNRKTPDINTSY